MNVHTLKPWTELVKLHPDVESGSLAEAVFAIDLGTIATGDPTTPKVYRDADAFFAATYVTTDLHKLLEEVLASLAGKGTFNRVLKLRTPFGGGKLHTLASLLHAARSRKSLNQIPECKGLSDPGPVGRGYFRWREVHCHGRQGLGRRPAGPYDVGLAGVATRTQGISRLSRSTIAIACRRQVTKSRRCSRQPVDPCCCYWTKY